MAAKTLLAPRQEAEQYAYEAVVLTRLRQQAQATGKVWQPLKHQIPPEGTDWFLLLLLGGRGSGKTDGAAYYVDQQARASVIRIAIIAPTLGDAVEACVNGPSGIKAHNPRVVLRGGAGGLHVRWPNGSEAKLFGAHSPEDVERLRAGGNRHLVWCVTGDTLIETEAGQRPIRNVLAGERVWTREGLRTVTASGLTRHNAPLRRIRTEDGDELCATPEHPLWVIDRGWVPCGSVVPSDKILAWNYITDPQHGLNGLASDGIAMPKTATTATVLDGFFTSLFGSTPLEDQSPQGMKSTTATKTEPTIHSTIWSFLPKPITDDTTWQPETQITLGTRRTVLKMRRRGLLAYGRRASRELWSALDAESSISLSGCVPDSVPRPVLRVSTVVSNESAGVANVYDLTVNGEHEFFANGFLVHNCEELAAWRYLDECWQHMRYGLRLGDHPRVVASTTPKPRKLLKQLVNDPRTEVRRATTDDNPYLNAGVRSALYEDYGGTRLGRQELGGELLEDVEGALWQAAWIEQARVIEAPEMVRIVVAVDPAATSEATSDYTGLCVAGLGTDGDYYVLRSMGVRLSPNGWAQKAIDWYDEFSADKVICEVNNGGDMVSSTLRAIRKDLPIKVIHASRGKTVRAEPIATLDEQMRCHHVGQWPTLEDQMFSFPVASEHDDEVDARVYALTELSEGRIRSYAPIW